MPSVFAWAGQAAVYAAIAAAVGYLSASPAYQQVPEGLAQIKISFRHGGARVEDCRKLTPEEIAKQPVNARRANTCSRERIPVTVEIRIDGTAVYEAVLETTASGVRTPDLGGGATTSAFAGEVVSRVRTKLEVWSSLGHSG